MKTFIHHTPIHGLEHLPFDHVISTVLINIEEVNQAVWLKGILPVHQAWKNNEFI